MKRNAHILSALQAGLIVFLGFWVFSPALHGEWLFDDFDAVVYNPAIHRWTGLWRIWFAPSGQDYFPLKDTAQWLQWHLFGKNTFGYHLTNIALHLFSALLVWRLLARLGIRLAWLGGLLFAIHPVTVESVAWISEIKNTLSLPFLLMAMLAYLHYDRHNDRISYLRSVAAFIAAMLCKTSVVMFPVIILLHGWWRYGKIRSEDWKRSAVFFGISLVLGLVTTVYQHNLPPGGEPIESLDPLSRLLCAGLIIAFYISKCFWPFNLDIVYFRWNVEAAAGWEIFAWLLVALFLCWLAIRRTPWARHALFGFLFFLLNLVPVLGFLKMIWTLYAWTADHLIYLPLIGLVGLAAACVSDLYDRYIPARLLISLAVAVVVATLAYQSHTYARVFDKSVVLWEYNLRNNPASWLGYNNLAVALAADGDPAGAIHQLQLGLQVKPGEALSYLNWGNALVQLGRAPEAIDAYRMAITLRPGNASFHNQLGSVLVQTGQLDQAIGQFQTAVQIDPKYVEAHSNLADAFIQTNRLQEAIKEGRSAVHLDPEYAEGHYNLGIALGQTGQIPEAATEFAIAARLSPDDPQIHYNLGIALLEEGNATDALTQFQLALQLDPHYDEARSAISRLESQGR